MYDFKYYLNEIELTWNPLYDSDVTGVEVRWAQQNTENWVVIYDGPTVNSIYIALPYSNMKCELRTKGGGGMGVWSPPEYVQVLPGSIKQGE